MLVKEEARPEVDHNERPALVQPNRRRAGHRSDRRRWWRALVAVGVLLALLAGLGGGAYLTYSSVKRQANQLQAQLTGHLELGQKELEAAKTSLKQANGTHDYKLVDQAKVHFINAKLQFLTAGQIADSSELLGRLEKAPSVGDLASSRHVAVDQIAAMGIHLSQAGMELADMDGLLIKPPSSNQQSQGLLAVVNQVKTKIDPVQAELRAALKAADGIDVNVVPSGQKATLQRAKDTISQALVAIDQFKSLVPIIVEILGGNGPRTYLIEQVNPAELRPGGGFIGTYSLLHADHGVLTNKSGDVTEFVVGRGSLGDPTYIEPPGPFREWLPYTGWSFIDSNFYVDFPSNARKAEEMVVQRLGHIDGVISIDYFTVAKLLAITGPITVPKFNLTLTGDNFIDTVVKYGLDTLIDVHAYEVHKAILFATAGPLFQRIVSLQSGQWPALISALNDLAAGRHLQAYFNSGDVQKTMIDYGWSGVVRNSGTPDYLMDVEANLGGTKANYFVVRHFKLELTHDRTNLHHRLSVDITDNTPYYPYRGWDYYSAYTRLLINGNTTAQSSNLLHGPPGFVGRTLPGPPPPPGLQQIEGWKFTRGYGNGMTMVFDWDTPWSPNHRGEEQIYWQKQPGTGIDKVDVIFTDGNSPTYHTSGDLAQDRVITLSRRGVVLTQGQLGTFQLPSLSLG